MKAKISQPLNDTNKEESNTEVITAGDPKYNSLNHDYNYNIFNSPKSNFSFGTKINSHSQTGETFSDNEMKIEKQNKTSITRDKRAAIQDSLFLKETPCIGLYNPKYSLTTKRTK